MKQPIPHLGHLTLTTGVVRNAQHNAGEFVPVLELRPSGEHLEGAAAGNPRVHHHGFPPGRLFQPNLELLGDRGGLGERRSKHPTVPERQVAVDALGFRGLVIDGVAKADCIGLNLVPIRTIVSVLLIRFAHPNRAAHQFDDAVWMFPREHQFGLRNEQPQAPFNREEEPQTGEQSACAW